MNILKKTILTTLSLFLTILWISFAAEAFPYTWLDLSENQNTNYASGLKSNISEEDNWFKQLLNIFMPDAEIYGWTNTSPSFIFYLKTIVNLLLSFVSFIALIFVIYAFYMIFFKKDDAGVTTARQILKWIVIALVVIWLSWIIVSFLYRVEKENTQNLWYKSNTTEIVTSLT